MSDTVVSAYITVGGMLGVSTVGAVTQILVAKWIIRSERAKVAAEAEARSNSEAQKHKYEQLLQDISMLLELTELDKNSDIDPGEVGATIHRISLLLDNHCKEHHGALNDKLVKLGLAVKESGYKRNPAAFLELHGQTLECAKRVLADYYR